MSLQRAENPISLYKTFDSSSIASTVSVIKDVSSEISLRSESEYSFDDGSEDVFEAFLSENDNLSLADDQNFESDQEKEILNKEILNKENAHRNAVKPEPDKEFKKKSAEKPLKKQEQTAPKIPLHKWTKNDFEKFVGAKNKKLSIHHPENKKPPQSRKQELHEPTVDKTPVCEECNQEDLTLHGKENQTSHHRKASWRCNCTSHPGQVTCTTSEAARKQAEESLFYQNFLKYLPKPFLNEKSEQPPKKINPTKRYDMYRKMWDKHRIPGENVDNDLRWCVRAVMLTGKVPEIDTYVLTRKDAIDRAKARKENP